mmetsp:Transcript_61901/g.128046  ORF Transcript_61901/g.128046 Transcript_61901/m.128046 type:complete len:286 (+) Transcript_61901:214-1071(+)
MGSPSLPAGAVATSTSVFLSGSVLLFHPSLPIPRSAHLRCCVLALEADLGRGPFAEQLKRSALWGEDPVGKGGEAGGEAGGAVALHSLQLFVCLLEPKRRPWSDFQSLAENGNHGLVLGQVREQLLILAQRLLLLNARRDARAGGGAELRLCVQREGGHACSGLECCPALHAVVVAVRYVHITRPNRSTVSAGLKLNGHGLASSTSLRRASPLQGHDSKAGCSLLGFSLLAASPHQAPSDAVDGDHYGGLPLALPREAGGGVLGHELELELREQLHQQALVVLPP